MKFQSSLRTILQINQQRLQCEETGINVRVLDRLYFWNDSLDIYLFLSKICVFRLLNPFDFEWLFI